MTEEKVKFGLVGAGSISRAYVQAFGHCTKAELIAIADVNEDAALSLASGVQGAKTFSSWESMCSTVELDAVILCTPPSTHEAISVGLLHRGINVLCEKPLCTSIESAERMRQAANESGRLLTMASKFRFVDDVVRAKDLLDAGVIGDLVLFENAFTSFVDMSERWNSVPAISGGGVLIDNGTHSLDLARYFLGPLVDVHVVEARRGQGLEVEDTVRVFVRNAQDSVGSIDLSWTINKELENYINLYGTRGSIRIGWKQSTAKTEGRDWVVFGSGYDKVKAFSEQIENFTAAIQYGEPLRVTLDDGIASVEVIEAAYESLRQDKWTQVQRSQIESLLELDPIVAIKE
jgi:predicted dehydrogenase